MTFVASAAKQRFLASEEAAWARDQLEQMENDKRYSTPTMPFYVHGQAAGVSYAEQHLTYLSEHPLIKVTEYIANLRLKSRKWDSR